MGDCSNGLFSVFKIDAQLYLKLFVAAVSLLQPLRAFGSSLLGIYWTAQQDTIRLDVRQLLCCFCHHRSDSRWMFVTEVRAFGEILGEMDQHGAVFRLRYLFDLIQIQLPFSDSYCL